MSLNREREETAHKLIAPLELKIGEQGQFLITKFPLKFSRGSFILKTRHIKIGAPFSRATERSSIEITIIQWFFLRLLARYSQKSTRVSFKEFPTSNGRDLKGRGCRLQMQDKLEKEMILKWWLRASQSCLSMWVSLLTTRANSVVIVLLLQAKKISITLHFSKIYLQMNRNRPLNSTKEYKRQTRRSKPELTTTAWLVSR